MGITTEVKDEQPVKATCPIEVTELGMSIEINAEQLEKAAPPIEVTELGISIENNAEQPEKAHTSIELTEIGIENLPFLPPGTVRISVLSLLYSTPSIEEKTVLSDETFISVRAEQPEKAPLPIEVTELGISTEVRAEQSSKATSPIEITELGILTEVSDEQS